MSDSKISFLDSRESDDGSPDPLDLPQNKPITKRRASRAGTRSVSTLNPEQLARKRANDREAQRSIRQRTKDHISNLEQKIAVLSGDQGQGRIDDVQRRNEELEQEVRMLRETLRRVEDAGGIASSPETDSLLSSRRISGYEDSLTYGYSPTSDYQNPYAQPRMHHTSFPTSSAGELMSTLIPACPPLYPGYNGVENMPGNNMNGLAMGSSGLSMPAVSARSRGTSSNSRPNFGRSRSYPNGSLGRTPTYSSLGKNLRYLPTNVAQTSAGQTYPPFPTLQNQSRMNQETNRSRISTLPICPLESLASRPIMEEEMSGMSPEMVPQQPPVPETFDMQPSFVNQPSVQSWELPLPFVPPTGPVDSILIGLLRRQRDLNLEERSGQELTTPLRPSFRGLVQPEMPDPSHPVSSILCNLLRRTSLPGLPVKAAALLVIYNVIQWQISPSQRTYNNLPAWHVPRASQLLTPHPFWATLMIWGKLRDVVIANQDRYVSDEFQHVYTASLNINWPYGEMNILNFDEDEVKVTEAFAEHCRELSNWSLDTPFQARYPELREYCKFTEYAPNGGMMQ